MNNGIYFYQENFIEYFKYCAGIMSDYPESCNDPHACATFLFDKKEGFLQSEEGREVIRKIQLSCISIGRIFICPMDEKINSEIRNYEKYSLENKKYKIMSRHKKVETPKRHFLADFMESKSLDERSYNFFMDNSYFIAKETYSETHGFSAGVYIFSFRKGDICKFNVIRKAVGEHKCFRVSYCDLPIH